jgi:digalactosyldiacylglycerol synthase
MGDLTALVPDDEADVCVMEEPEHLNWFRAHGALWTDKFNYVVGIIHTNYLFYAGQEMGGSIKREVYTVLHVTLNVKCFLTELQTS